VDVLVENTIGIELDSIIKKGKLIAITNNTPTSYFIYKGKPMGYQYQLLRDFTKHLGVDLEIKIIPSIPDALDSLKLLKADIVASGLTILGDRKQHVDFSIPITQTHQVLIQKIPEDLLSKSKSLMEKRLLRDVTQLAGKEVYVEEGSSYIDRLHNLQDEIGDSINIITYSGEIGIDSIMKMVSTGQIDYAISDQYTSNFFLRYYSNLDIETSVSLNQNIAWAVPKNSNSLMDTINSWIIQNRNTTKWVYVYNTYFKHNRSMNQKVNSGYNLDNGKISPYDKIIKIHADKISWDWKLIAAQISVESGFKPSKKSWAGASGLMQIMPATANGLNPQHTDIYSPNQNIAMGVKLDGILFDYWKEKIPDSIQSIKFTLASYNIGKGHVFDAQRLAEKYELNPQIWDNNVELMIKKLSSKNYYRDTVVRYGYCRGSEAYNYVKRIFFLYQNYQNFEIPDD
jgi:membrane-bound lytic murein transglycosylase F